ncbi:galactokinase [Clostridium tetanomorphum]|nr:galactokinase [Clostridium tetanomorphum DSM 665]MBP1865341.1 galactokinase [Clostridium tetanomorphum]NRS85264.1 galactokinase [Clostridium tetanomorphum]NRZ98441.1 galactokinase [Clostridium tetanomorphum]SQC03026.1 galactokinase [Clostridium tetanomorphum]
MEELISYFKSIYGEDGEEIRLFYAPGRVNLIGEHTDYNGGYVFPCSLDMGTYAAIRKRKDNKIFFTSMNFPLKIEINNHNITYDCNHGWANYPKGILNILCKLGYSFSGFEVMFKGNIPNGAGLSSSASIEIAMAIAINELYNLNISMIDLVKISQRAENEFVRVNCGIMDQFAVGMGKRGKAILLKCDTLEYRYVNLNLEDYKIIISNSNKRRDLADSKYNERRQECERALKYLQKELCKKSLGDITIEEFNEYSSIIPEKVLIKRARHVISENNRVLEAVKALEKKDLIRFGQLMISSHISLKNDYEVTGYELDVLVEEALKVDGVLGSRMTGAGFGGCTVSLVKKKSVEKFILEVSKNYKKRVKYEPSIYVMEIGYSAREIK